MALIFYVSKWLCSYFVFQNLTFIDKGTELYGGTLPISLNIGYNGVLEFINIDFTTRL